MEAAELAILLARVATLYLTVQAEGNRRTTPEEDAELDALFLSAEKRHAASTAAREAAGG